MLLRGGLAGAIIAEVILVHAIDDVLVAALAADFAKTREELVFAVEAAVGVVAQVIGIVELAALDVFVHDAELLHEGFEIALVGFGQRRRIGGDGEGAGAQHAMRGPRQIGRVGATGESYDHAAQRSQEREQLALLLLQAGRGCKIDQRRHTYSLLDWTGPQAHPTTELGACPGRRRCRCRWCPRIPESRWRRLPGRLPPESPVSPLVWTGPPAGWCWI